jgi:hypothetical protein
MGDTQPDREPEPEIALRQLFAEDDRVSEGWNIAWQVENRGAHPLKILAVRLPHGQFKSEEARFRPALELDSGTSSCFDTLVHCQEPPGLVTENAFAIFLVEWLGQTWRIFVRLRVSINSSGEPETATELVTTQRVGFSGVA